MATSGPPPDFWETYFPPEFWAQREFPTDQIKYFYYPPRPDIFDGPPPTPPGGPGPECQTYVGAVPNAISLTGGWYAIAIVEIGGGGVSLTTASGTVSIATTLQQHDIVDFAVSISVPVFGPELNVQYGGYVTSRSASDVDPTRDPVAAGGNATGQMRIMPGAIATASIDVQVSQNGTFGGSRTLVISSRGSAGSASSGLVGPPYYAPGRVVIDHCGAGVTPSLTLDPALPDDIREWAVAAYRKHDWSPLVPYTDTIRIGAHG